MSMKKVNPKSIKRCTLLKTISDRGLSLDAQERIGAMLRGRTDEEKEVIAEILTDEVNRGLWDSPQTKMEEE